MEKKNQVILGVAASDAHVVANHLIAHWLRGAGYEVLNLGACTPLEEFAAAAEAHPDAAAILIGSLNGHALDDLGELPCLRATGRIRCPVLVGGNVSVGAHKTGRETERLLELGVDRVLGSFEEILPALRELRAEPRAASALLDAESILLEAAL